MRLSLPWRRSLSLLLAAAVLLLLPRGLFAQSLEDKVVETTLPNGLRLLIVERHDSPTFAAYITFGVGAVDEYSNERGVAHLLEHMLFKGTRTIGTTDFAREEPLLKEIERVGSELDRLRGAKSPDAERIVALEKELHGLQERQKEFVVKDEFAQIYSENGGVGYNAFTSKDMTTYVVSLPANKLELWARLEADRMQNAVLREFYTERDVVMEERRRSVETNPGRFLYENLMATAFEVHPYREPTIGWSSDIANLTLAETRDFLHRYYAPANAVIALVGDIDPSGAQQMVERYFGPIAPGTPVPPVTVVEPPQRGERRVDLQFDAEPQLAIAFHKPTLPSREDYVFDLIDLILSEGRTSRLYKSLVVEQQLATSVSTYAAPGSRYPHVFVVAASPRHPHTLREVEQAIETELDRLTREPVSTGELEQARTRLRVDRVRSLQDNDGLARMLTYYQTVAGDWRYLVDYERVVAEITPEEIMAAARTYLTPTNRTVGTLSQAGGGS